MSILPRNPDNEWTRSDNPVTPELDVMLARMFEGKLPGTQQIFYVLSGGFDPVTDAHIELIQSLKYPVWIILNSDKWLEKKKGVKFMPLNVRERIMRGIKNVYDVTVAADSDDGTVTETLRLMAAFNTDKVFIFVNSGDRKPETTPEYDALNDKFKNLKFEWVDSARPNSHSSDFLSTWGNNFYKEKLQVDPFSGKIVPSSPYNGDPLLGLRPWGKWLIIHEDHHERHKLLVVDPYQKLSFQRHKNRTEEWRLLAGTGLVRLDRPTAGLQHFRTVTIAENQWHQLANDRGSYLIVYEIQKSKVKMGCEETDIERV